MAFREWREAVAENAVVAMETLDTSARAIKEAILRLQKLKMECDRVA